jgi:hypothetical protein
VVLPILGLFVLPAAHLAVFFTDPCLTLDIKVLKIDTRRLAPSEPKRFTLHFFYLCTILRGLYISMIMRPKILVLRGGSKNHALSIVTGAHIVGSLHLYGGEAVDVYIDQEGMWYKNGLLVEPLHTLSYVDAYIDTVNQSSGEAYHGMAERLGVLRLLHSKKFPFSLSREMLFRVLRQHNILAVETVVFRKGEDVTLEKTRDIFTRILAPYILRSIHGALPGVVVHTHKELVEKLQNMTEVDDIEVTHYRNAKTRSIVAMPSYRDEELYMTLPLEAQIIKYEKPSKDSRLLPLSYLSSEEKKSIHYFVRQIYEALEPESPFLVDFVTTKRGHMVTGITTSPNILSGGRFLESLATTGTDIAHYALDYYGKKQKSNVENKD